MRDPRRPGDAGQESYALGRERLWRPGRTGGERCVLRCQPLQGPSGLALNDVGHIYTFHTSIAKVGSITDILWSQPTPAPRSPPQAPWIHYDPPKHRGDKSIRTHKINRDTPTRR